MFLQKSKFGHIHLFSPSDAGPNNMIGNEQVYSPQAMYTRKSKDYVGYTMVADKEKTLSVQRAFIEIVNRANYICSIVEDSAFNRKVRSDLDKREGGNKQSKRKMDSRVKSWTKEQYNTLIQLLLLKTTMDDAIVCSLCRFLRRCEDRSIVTPLLLDALHEMLNRVPIEEYAFSNVFYLYVYFCFWFISIEIDSKKPLAIEYLKNNHNPTKMIEDCGTRVCVVNTMYLTEEYKHLRPFNRTSYYVPTYKGTSRTKAVSDVVFDIDNCVAFHSAYFVLYVSIEDTEKGGEFDRSDKAKPKGSNPFGSSEAENKASPSPQSDQDTKPATPEVKETKPEIKETKPTPPVETKSSDSMDTDSDADSENGDTIINAWDDEFIFEDD